MPAQRKRKTKSNEDALPVKKALEVTSDNKQANSSTHGHSRTSKKKQMSVGKAVTRTVSRIVGNDLNARRLLRADYDRPSVELCKYLLGKTLVSYLVDSGTRVCGRIVEMEAYPGGVDKGSSTYGGRRTESVEPLYMSPGTAYVYMTYGMYSCMNISSKGDGGAVLIRGLEPLEGLDLMKAERSKKHKSNAKLKDFQLCNGPSKLTMALNITKTNSNRVDLTTSEVVYIEHADDVDDNDIVECSRIGLSARAGEWRNKPMRFYIKKNKCVSVIDNKAELNEDKQ